MGFDDRYAYIYRKVEIMENLKQSESIILTEKDKKINGEEIASSNKNDYYSRREFKKLSDIMLVHKTNYAPKNSTIESRISANVMDTVSVTIFGQSYDINLRPCRDTVHFCANHEVTANNGGNWDLCKYAVITPLLNIPKKKFRSNCPVDTFVEGAVLLKGKSYVLCPKEEMETVKMNNPGLIVVGYEGNSLGYANTLLWILGYPVAYGNSWGFSSSQNQKAYEEIVLKAGYKSLSPHFFSEENIVENSNISISYAVGILELIINHPELHNIDSYELAEETKLFTTLCYCDTTTPGYLNKLLSEIGLNESYTNKFASNDEFDSYCISLIDEAKQLRTKKLS